MKQLGLLFLLLGFCGMACAALQHPELNKAQQARYHSLNEQLRCMICQSRSIAGSDAPLAADMRDIVASQILAGRSNSEIKQFLVQRYGKFILYKPPFSPLTWLLWLGPALFLLIALLAAFYLWRRGRKTVELPPPDADAIQRVVDNEPRQ